jgi:gamma-glutamylcysteine synthetase
MMECARWAKRFVTPFPPELFHGRWRGSVDPIFAEFAY